MKHFLVDAVAVVAFGAVCAAYPPLRARAESLFTSEKSHVSGMIDAKYVPIHPVTVTASGQTAAHPGKLASDGFYNTYWLAPWTASPELTLTMTFAHPVTLKRLILFSGAYQHYVADGRPSSLQLVFSNQESFTITPQDTPKAQTFSISHAVLIKSVQFRITATYQGSAGANSAISEIELFGIQ